MNFLLMVLVGAFAGWFASLITNEDRAMGPIANITVGVVGSILGGVVYSLFFNGSAAVTTAFLNFRPIGLIVSVLGSTLLISVLKYFRRANLLRK